MSYSAAPLMHVFIDETGTIMSGKNESNLYICVAVFVKDSDREKLIVELSNLCKAHGVGPILKSSGIGSNHQRRIAILEELCTLNFTYIFLMTDKSKIFPDSGLKYKRSRYKFIHNRLNRTIETRSCNLNIVIDKYGDKNFQEECGKYYNSKRFDLFGGDVDIVYADDKDQTLLQISDFIGGSLLYCFDKTRSNEFSQQIRGILQSKETGCDFFPRGIFPTLSTRPLPDDNLQDELYHHLYNNAVRFLDNTQDSTDTIKQMQFQTLNSLFMARNYESPDAQWIYSDKLFDDLISQKFEIKKRAFTVNIVGGLRRQGIIIAGSPSGYKLALSMEDINNYLSHDSNIIFPMLDKLKLAKDLVHSLIGFNILTGEYMRFDSVLLALTTAQIQQYTAEPDLEKIEMIHDEEE